MEAREALESARGTLAAAAAALLPKVLDRSCKAHPFAGACDEAMCLFAWSRGTTK